MNRTIWPLFYFVLDGFGVWRTAAICDFLGLGQPILDNGLRG